MHCSVKIQILRYTINIENYGDILMMKNRLLLSGFLSLTQFFVMSSSFAMTVDRRTELLEQALAPTTPKELAALYAKAIDDRNGAVQYMLLCPALQEKQRNAEH